MDGYTWNYEYPQAQPPYVYPDYTIDNPPLDMHSHMAHQMPPPQFHPEMQSHMPPPQIHPQMPPPQMDMPPQMLPNFPYDEMPPQMQMPPQLQPNFTHEPVNHPFNTLNTSIPGTAFMPGENGYSAPPFPDQSQYQYQQQIPSERAYAPNNPSSTGPWLQSPQVPSFNEFSDTNGQVYEYERSVYPNPQDTSPHDEYYGHFPPEQHKVVPKRNARMRSRSLNASDDAAASRFNVIRERRPPPPSNRGFNKIREKRFDELASRVPFSQASDSRSDQDFNQRYQSESPNRLSNQNHRSPRRSHESRSEIKDEYPDSRNDYTRNIDDLYDTRSSLNKDHTRRGIVYSRSTTRNSSREKDRLQKERVEKKRDLLGESRRHRDHTSRRCATENSSSDEEFHQRPHRTRRDSAATKGFNPTDTLDLSSLRQALNAAVKENGHNGTKSRKNANSPDSRQPRVVSPPREKPDEKQLKGILRQPRVVSPPREKSEEKPVRGILRQPRDKFPEDYDSDIEGLAQVKNIKRNTIPYDARWTKISRRVVNPEALDYGEERYEARQEFVIVLRVLTKEVIQAYANLTHQIRELRDRDERAQATKFANLHARSDQNKGKRSNIRQTDRFSIYDEYDSDSYFESDDDYISDHEIANMRGRNMNPAGYIPNYIHDSGVKRQSMKNGMG